MLIVFDREKLVFDARDLLPGIKTEIINLPISIEVKFFEGVAPCGLALVVKQDDYPNIKEILLQNDIKINYVFEVSKDDKEYKRIKA